MTGSTGSPPKPRLHPAADCPPAQAGRQTAPLGLLDDRSIDLTRGDHFASRTLAESLRIPFNVPSLGRRSAEYALAALARGPHSGDGPFTRAASELLGRMHRGRRALLTTSGTHALEMAAVLLDLGPGDEVIVPSFTFASTASAIAHTGATPVFVDVDVQSLGVDPDAAAAAVTPRTKAIFVVHYAGIAADMDRIGSLADQAQIAIVEDNAHGLGGHFRGQPLGTLGDFAALSFHETKNVQCGEGGALVINDASATRRAEIIREKGTNRSAFFRGEVAKYTWIENGSSYLMSDILAAVLLGGLEDHEEIRDSRLRVWHAYDESLGDWAEAVGARRPTVPDGCDHPGHLYYLVLPSERARDGLLAHLGSRGILATSHYVPLHRSPAGRALGRQAGTCRVSEEMGRRLARLPLFPSLTAADVDSVIDAVTGFRG